MPQTTMPVATVMEYLSSDHRRLDAIMHLCQAHAEKGDMPAAAVAFSSFTQGLLRHIRIEEEILFPAFDAATGLHEGGPTAVMKMEHLEIQRLLGSIQSVFESPEASPAEFESLRSALVALLHEHNVKEERIVYPMTDRMTPPNDRLNLVRRMLESR